MKYLGLLVVAALIAAVSFAEIEDVAKYQNKSDLQRVTKAVAANFVKVQAQADTNVTTTVTGYTPDYAGQVLIGGAGTGTNGVWISKGITTNDWVQVAP